VYRMIGSGAAIARRRALALAVALATAQTLPIALQAQGGAVDPNRIDVICLDAGHGGKDPGNLGTGRYKTTEKHVALNVTKLLGKYIREEWPDMKVVYTREDDRFVELNERCAIANKAKADVFISIHCNANAKHEPHGAETYFMGLHKTEANMRTAMQENASILLEDGHDLKYDGYDPKDPESMIALSLRQNVFMDQSAMLSAAVQEQFRDRAGRSDRGVKQAGFLVISYTTMPAILIELGFLTNADEEDYMQSTKGQEHLASAIYRAFKSYKATIESKGAQVAVAPLPERPDTVTPEKEEKGADQPRDNGVRFKVQIVTSSKRIDLKPKNFNGLEGVQEMKGNDLWKYTVGDERTLEDARALQRTCREKGFEGCFIVAFKEGARIDLQQAVTLARQP
ncbi:MAG TPA: N-acetylmuramoyl-L-alanine amidase, partial [Flavobacteriales bacterium]|nr:N-acetylmuramoyl-L-alanine amidase [Flavobacteriales bacterium]